MRIGILVLAAAIIIGGGAYWLTRDDGSINTNTNSANASANDPVTTTSIKKLLADGKAVQCTFSFDETDRQDWTIYSDGQRVRGDYLVLTSPTDTWEGHIITDSEYHYNWSNYGGRVAGTKIKLSAVTNTNVATPSNTNAATDINQEQEVDMRCRNWTVDSNKFTPPSDVTFTDLSAALEQAQTTVDSAKAAACSACNANIDEAARVECRQALGC